MLAKIVFSGLALVHSGKEMAAGLCVHALRAAGVARDADQGIFDKGMAPTSFFFEKLEQRYTLSTGNLHARAAARALTLAMRKHLRSFEDATIPPEDRRAIVALIAKDFVHSDLEAIHRDLSSLIRLHDRVAPLPAEVIRKITRDIFRSTWRAYGSRPRGAFARREMRRWLEFVITRDLIPHEQWREMLKYDRTVRIISASEALAILSPDVTSDRDLYPMAVADALKGDWSRLGFSDFDVEEFALNSLLPEQHRPTRRTVPDVVRDLYLTREQLGMIRLHLNGGQDLEVQRIFEGAWHPLQKRRVRR